MEAINLNRLAYFAAVVDAGSFTRAADRLGISKTVVSQQVMKLEQELRATLLMRTTRRVEATEAGRLLHARAVAILKAAEDAFAEIAGASAEPIGVLRIAAPNDYGATTIAPLATAFSRRYPSCQVDLKLSDSRIDLIANQIDLSIRVGWLEDSGLQARRVGAVRQILVAAPDFAAGLKVGDPDDLAGVAFIANGALRNPLHWQFSNAGREQRTVLMHQAMVIDATPGVLAATLAGGGLSVMPDYEVTDHLAKGLLVEILPAWSLPAGGIYTVYPAARFRPTKVTAFVAMLVEHLEKVAGAG